MACVYDVRQQSIRSSRVLFNFLVPKKNVVFISVFISCGSNCSRALLPAVICWIVLAKSGQNMKQSGRGIVLQAMSLTSSKTAYKQGMHPLMPGGITAPYPYCLHCPVRDTVLPLPLL